MSRSLTVVACQAPAGCHTPHASREVVTTLGDTHGRHAHVHLDGAGELDEQDVVVDGVAVVARVFEHLMGKHFLASYWEFASYHSLAGELISQLSLVSQ